MTDRGPALSETILVHTENFLEMWFDTVVQHFVENLRCGGNQTHSSEFCLLVRSPFFGIDKIAALRQTFGASPELKTLLQTFSRCSKSAPDLQTSAGMLSSPVALPDEVLLVAEVSSSIVNSWTGIGNVSEMIVSISSGCGGRDAGLPGRFLKCPSNSLLLSDGLSPDGLAA